MSLGYFSAVPFVYQHKIVREETISLMVHFIFICLVIALYFTVNSAVVAISESPNFSGFPCSYTRNIRCD